MRTSPDIQGRGLIEAIAEARGLDLAAISLGAGSSEIIHRVLPRLAGNGTALLLDPTYSEYAFVLDRVRRLPLSAADGFRVDLDALISMAQDASLVVLVNPNNPTGQALSRGEVLTLRAAMPAGAVLWVDEAYVDYCPAETSVERDAVSIEGLYVLKSLSKAYALSGVRAAYLVGRSPVVVPPWIIGTSAQAAARAAVFDEAYYRSRWAETGQMVADFAGLLRAMGLTVFPGEINAVLVESPVRDWAVRLAEGGLIVRTPEGTGEVLGDRYVRIGLCEPRVWPRIFDIVAATLAREPAIS